MYRVAALRHHAPLFVDEDAVRGGHPHPPPVGRRDLQQGFGDGVRDGCPQGLEGRAQGLQIEAEHLVACKVGDFFDERPDLDRTDGAFRIADEGSLVPIHAHHNDAPITQVVQVELVADAGSQGGDDGLDLLVVQDLVKAGSLGVEDLAPQGEDGLEGAVAPLLGAAAGRVALDDEELRLGRIPLRAVGQLARQRQALQGALADHQLPRLAGRRPRPRRGQALLDNPLRRPGVLFQKVAQRLADYRLDDPLDLGVHQLHLGLGLELGIGVFDADDGRQPLPHVLAGEILIALLQQAVLPGVIVDDPGDGRPQPRQVGPAVHRVDGVGEGVDGLGVPLGVLEGGFHLHTVDLLLHVDGLVEHAPVAVQVEDEGADPPLEVEGHLAGEGLLPLVHQPDGDAPGEESHLPEALGQGLEAVVHPLEDGRVVAEGNGRSGPLGLAHHLYGSDRDAPLVALAVELAVALDLGHQPFGKGVDGGDADAVEAAGDLVAAAAELAAGVQRGHHQLQGGDALLRVDVYRDAPPVVPHRDAAVLVDGHLDLIAGAGQRLIHRVVHHLVDQVVQRLGVRTTHVHPRPAPNRLQPF